MGQADFDLLAASLVGTSVWNDTVCVPLALCPGRRGLGLAGGGICCARLRSASRRARGLDSLVRARSHGDQPRLNSRRVAQCFAGGRDPACLSLRAGWGPTGLAYRGCLRRPGPTRQGPDRAADSRCRRPATCHHSKALDCDTGLAGGPASLGHSAWDLSALVRLATGGTWPGVR